MIELIHQSDFMPYKAISANINASKKLTPYIVDAQMFDLKDMIGNAFFLDLYNDVLGSPTLIKYLDLWNGSEWTCNNKLYKHEGLKTVLIYLSYYRYVMNCNQEETAFGMVIKKEENSIPVSEKTILRNIENAKSGAWAIFKDVECFLNDNNTNYPLWNYCCGTNKKRGSVMAVEPNECNYKYNRRDRYS